MCWVPGLIFVAVFHLTAGHGQSVCLGPGILSNHWTDKILDIRNRQQEQRHTIKCKMLTTKNITVDGVHANFTDLVISGAYGDG